MLDLESVRKCADDAFKEAHERGGSAHNAHHILYLGVLALEAEARTARARIAHLEEMRGFVNGALAIEFNASVDRLVQRDLRWNKPDPGNPPEMPCLVIGQTGHVDVNREADVWHMFVEEGRHLKHGARDRITGWLPMPKAAE